MAEDLYEKLAKFLDELPAGFPRTESGVELRILRRLFSPEDAALALHLTPLPEEPRVIAHRAGIPLEGAARRLEEMDQKGLIYSIHPQGRPPQYMALQFFVGFFESQVDKLSPELVRDFEEYLFTFIDPELWRKAPQMRTIPVGESISHETAVMPYEQAEALVRANEVFAVGNCICRQEQHILGKGCDRPMETCLSLGMFAEHSVRVSMARAIDRDEALAILHRAEEAGLVLQPANAKDAAFICACCGCCCDVLRSIKRHPRPASIVASAFVAAHNAETCTGCGTCEERCQMEAIRLAGDTAVLDLDRCIGCGLCVTTCPSGSLSLRRKPEAEQPYVPKDIVDTSIKVGQARGKMAPRDLIAMQLRSKLDRLAARK